MKLNHLSLPVPDVAAATAFFETYFGFTCTGRKGDNMIAVLEDGEGFTLVLSKADEDSKFSYARDFHIGFMQQTEAQVTEIYNNLKAGGINVERQPKKIRDTFGFYFTAPGGFLVEVACPMEV